MWIRLILASAVVLMMLPVAGNVGIPSILAQTSPLIHTCRHSDNGVEATYTISVFVACTPKAAQCAQFAAQSFKAPPNVHFIKGFADPLLRPWDSSGVPNRCDPKGNADVPCWAQSELVVYKRAPNPKCLCDSD
jgi:hypothetical protein